MGPVSNSRRFFVLPGGRVDQRAVIGSKSREGGQVMGADQDIDAVDLMKGEPVDGPLPSRGRDRFRTRRAEALGWENNPPRLGEGGLSGFVRLPRRLRPNSGPISTAAAPTRMSAQPGADGGQTLAQQERARKRGEDALKRQDEGRHGGRRMRLGENWIV